MKVLICGASVEGLTLAWCLARQGHDVAVVEPKNNLGDEDYMIGLFGAGYDASERLGLARLESIHDPVDRMVILDANGRERVSIAYPILRRRLFRNRHLNVMRYDLVNVLYERVKGYCDVRFGTTIASLDRDEQSVRVGFADGSITDAELLVGADGLQSLVRRLAFGAELRCRQFLGDYAVAFVIDDVPSPLERGRAAVTLTVPGRQVTVYPIRRGRMATLFLHRAQRIVDDFSPAAARLELHSMYGDLGWFVPQLLDCCTASAAIHFGAVEQIRLARWSVGRVVLVGESCHGVSPLPGQGTSLAVAGACELAEALGQSYDAKAAFARYERRLRPAVHGQQRAARLMSKWLVPASAFGVTLRNVATGMAVWPAAASIVRHRPGVQSLLGV